MRERLRRPETWIAGAFALLVLGYAAVMAFVLDGVFGPRVGFGPDSQIYMDAAREPVWSLDFLAARGPFLFLVLAKFCARNLRAIVLVQSVISVGAWVFLAASVRSVLRHRVMQVVGFTAILLVALAPPLLQWNVIVSTESLSVSVMVLLIGLALRLAAAPGRAVVAFAVGLVAFVFVRDTNAVVALALGCGAVVLAVTRPAWRRVGAVVAVTGLAAAVLALALSNQSEPPRWYYPLHETIALRLVGDDTAEPYFVEHGLPLDEDLVALGDNYYIVHTRLDDGPEFAELRTWVRDDGRSTYTTFLVTHPWWTLREPLADYERFLVPDLDGYTLIWHLDPWPIYEVSAVAYPPWVPVVGVWVVLCVVAFGALVVRRAVAAPILVTVGLVLGLSVAGFYAAWHGDALEIDRHSLTAAVQLRIALWLVTLLAIDAVLSRSRVEEARDADLEQREEHGGATDEGRPEPVGG
ncbi:MAG: hypothetical protein SGJ13_00565 [Actinomycetota bacterium]|nr:hypothetical protein [Actinomycetota bacterium]